MAVVVALLLGSSLAAALVGSASEDPAPILTRSAAVATDDLTPSSEHDDAPEEDGQPAAGIDDGGEADEPSGDQDAEVGGAGEDPSAVDRPAPAVTGAERPASAPEVDLEDQIRDRRLTLALDRWLAEHPAVGSVAVAVVAGGPSGYRWSRATARSGARAPLDLAARYPILSITKTFTEALVLREAERGAIDLDAPMPAIAGVAPVPDDVVITPRMLLQHSSGLVNYMNADGYDPTAPMTPAHAVSLSLGTPLASSPGAVARYSNSNFHWLGLLLEHVTARSFGDLVAELAATTGLASTALDPAARPGWVGFASGGMRSTVPEVASWGAQLFTPGIVLSPASHRGHVAVGPLGVGLGVWPICPCTTDAAGSVEYTAVGQIVADGGLLWFPAGNVVVAVRMASVPGDVGSLTAGVAGAVRAALVDDDPDRVA
jgi:CubicO group peptidase (beta-lactamase class C family)